MRMKMRQISDLERTCLDCKGIFYFNVNYNNNNNNDFFLLGVPSGFLKFKSNKVRVKKIGDIVD